MRSRKLMHTVFPAFMLLLLAAGYARSDEGDGWSDFPAADGRFEGTWGSLDSYTCPEWFRDAKFGIWAIIGPQCVPMQGDWYARHMYIEGHPQYNHHLKHYGHPSEHGYKDLIEEFDPDELDFSRLVGLYKEAGAKYAVILAVHHDNFDLWDSRHHEWNSVRHGPRRDLVGEFRRAALDHGLRFGVTTHLARSYSWFQTNKGADRKGAKKGVPYDGTDPEYASLYHPAFPENRRYPDNPPEVWQRNWYLRVKDLIDRYRPDLMYFDGGVPFDDGAVGRRLMAHYYNASMQWHDGRLEAVLNVKKLSDHGAFRDGTCVQDIERGMAGELRDLPWQTDTCIGGWYYRTGIRYKTVEHAVQMLVDIVSKNGNMLLNIPLLPNGSIDDQEAAFLRGMGGWMKVNGEALYGTRPWIVYGEGRTKSGGGYFREAPVKYRAGDFRFTAKGERTLYAFAMAWPADGMVTIRSLAGQPGAGGVIEKVEMLGHPEPLIHEQTPDGLSVKLPEEKPCAHAWALKITGRQLRDFPSREIVYTVKPDREGDFLLDAADAEIHGPTPRLEQKSSAQKQNIGYWDNWRDSVSWRIEAPEKGDYDVTVRASSAYGISDFVIEMGARKRIGRSRPTLSWEEFVTIHVGRLRIDGPGEAELVFRPRDSASWKPLGLLDIRLEKVKKQRRYEPDWSSLDARPAPQWYLDAKFGVFICWGLYSVPAWSLKGRYAEWYQYWLQENAFNGKVRDFHAVTYGDDFAFKDFAPLFKAELFDPDEWAELMEKAGAKYIVFTTKHHSGYTLWPSAEAEKTYGLAYNPAEVGPKRDLVGDLVAAVRKRKIRAGLYYSLYEWYHPLWKSDRTRFVDEHLFPQFKDLVTRYRPDIVWSDGEWDMPWEKWKSPELLAWLFNNVPNESELVINDRWGKGARHKHGTFYTTEYGSGMDDDAHPWEESRGMGYSYGYNRAEDLEDYRTAQELILMLIDTVSRGGNLCLDIGPRADGKIPVIMQERLLEIGEWLAINGEAIYGTRMWKVPCQWSAGKRPAVDRKKFMAKYNILEQTVSPPDGQAHKEALFTCKDGNLFVFTPDWPEGELRLRGVLPESDSEVTVLETGQKLSWRRDGTSLIITVPSLDPGSMKSRFAYVFQVSGAAATE